MIQIKRATADDVPLLYEMIMEIARHHHQEQHVATDQNELLKAGFETDSQFGALIAFDSGSPAGYISYTPPYSIWLGATFMKIDDVFVKESFRGKKIGKALMEEIKVLCNNLSINRVKWEVERDNTAAIRFYERLGATVNVKGVFSWDLS